MAKLLHTDHIQLPNIQANNIYLNKNLIKTIIKEVIKENKKLFISKNYLNIRNDRNIKLVINTQNEVYITLDVNAQYCLNLLEVSQILQAELKMMIEHMTSLIVSQVNINLVNIDSK
ncbi:MAG: Asp23/Gls24 family envelope stress response protein [Bacilli bacterium]